MKRIYALALVVILLLSPVCAAQAPTGTFSDQQKIVHINAVQMLVDLGLVTGCGDGSFQPDRIITREETAKLMALLCEPSPQTDAPVPFSDVSPSWSADYIAYCAQKDIIVGSGGKFRPKDGVTVRELAKMLLVILGGDAEKYVGSDWDYHVDADAYRLGLYKGYSGALDQPAPRDDACLLIFNALQCCPVVHPEQEGVLRYALDELMNPLTFMELRFGLVRYTAVLRGNEYADLDAPGTAAEPGMTRLAGHNKLFRVSTAPSLLGRQVNIYLKDGNVVGVPCYTENELYYTFSSPEEMNGVLRASNGVLSEKTQYFLNFAPADASILELAADGSGSTENRITVIDHDGDMSFDVVLLTSCTPCTVVSLSPLAVRVNGGETEVAAFSSEEIFRVGQQALYCQIGGRGFLLGDE